MQEQQGASVRNSCVNLSEISEPLLRIDMAANTPGTPFALGLSRSSPARVHLLPANAMQLLPELLCHVFGFSALTPIRWVELCPSGGQVRPVLYEFLGCPHASDDLADAFLVANPVVLEALWSGGESGLGSFHVLDRC